jgi:nanoRNase/pAp phosphatase (c-di-AMP/oligoRNAs hydrolase)
MRLVTRSDFDGLVCGVLLKDIGVIDTSMKFVHPKDIQDGKVEVDENDVLTNIPYVPGCGLWFDHHSSEEERALYVGKEFEGSSMSAPSAARVIWEYYGGREKFPQLDSLMAAVDKFDSAQLDVDDVLHPLGWMLAAFVMDPRTGLGRYHDYRISNYQLMEDMIEYCRSMNADEILALPDVQERTTRYFEQEPLFKKFLDDHSSVHDNVLVTDLCGVSETPCGNRFMPYALYLDPNISIRIFDGKAGEFCVFAVGHSIFNRTSQTNVGSLLLKHGGGGHERAGTCQVSYEDADRVRDELIAQMNEDG